jgi:hypothetical protein
MDDDDILTEQEEEKINYLLATKYAPPVIQAKCMAVAGMASFEPVKFTFGRGLGFNPHVTITNISGKNAWVILAPAPIISVESIGIDKIGNISFSTTGDYKCQQILLRNNKTDDYELDTSQIYYSVFFDCDGTWKTPFKNRKINTRKYNINLLERHVVDSIDSSEVPI